MQRCVGAPQLSRSVRHTWRSIMRTVNQTDLRPWRAVVPDSCADWFSSLKVPWWVAGGWALDLYTGEQSRAHEDLDVGVLRANISSVLDALSSFEVFEAKD